jgi:Xaa-Pro aminopeptidase
MSGIAERINTPISTAELERRWKLVRARMETAGIDVLVMQNNNDFMGGYVKYFTDIPATNGYPFSVIFPRDGEMTVIGQGPFGMDAPVAHDDPLRRGVGRAMGSPSYASASYCNTYDAALAAKALQPFAKARIGFLGLNSMTYAFVNHIKTTLAGANFVDASDLVDLVRAIKSPEEVKLFRAAAAMQDMQMRAAFAAVKPGVRDYEVMSAARHAGTCVGSEQGWYMCASGPVGTAAVMGPPHLQNRMIQAGDQYTILVENSGAGGMYTELGRTCVLGKASQEMKDEFAFVLEARQHTLELLKPGASCADIWEKHNAFMRKHGRPEEQRLYCHSQGYDMVERPLVRFDETMTIEANMVLAVHPTYVTATTYSWACDNYFVSETGVERLHAFPEIITEIG